MFFEACQCFTESFRGCTGLLPRYWNVFMFLLMLALVVLYVLRSECDPKSNSSREVRHSARYTDDSKDFYTHTFCDT